MAVGSRILTNRDPAINRRPRRTSDRHGLGPVPCGCHTHSRRPPHGTRSVGLAGAGAPSRSTAAAATPAGSRPAPRVLGPLVPESAGDHDRAAAAPSPPAARRAGPAHGGDAAVARPADRRRTVPDSPHLGTAPARPPHDLARPDRLSGALPGGRARSLAGGKCGGRD